MTDELLGGRYRRERMLGSGAMGEVWLAEDTLLGRTVAIKHVATASVASGMTTPSRQDLLDRITREARLAARISHPNAVSVHDMVTVDGQPFVVMEYVAGPTLADEVAARGPLPRERVAAVGAAVADALADAHRLDIVHRDIKPANILLDRRGEPKLADFGIARVFGDGTATGVMLGTPAFVAPEVARGEAATSASDIWSLGITLYAALDGRSPYQRDGDDTPLGLLGRVLTVVPEPPRNGGSLNPVIMRMLASRPEDRPTAAELAMLLRSAFDGDDTDAASDVATRLRPTGSSNGSPTVDLPSPGRHRRRWAVGAGVATAVAAAAVVLIATTGSGDAGRPAETPVADATSATTSTQSTPAVSSATSPVVAAAAPPVTKTVTAGAPASAASTTPRSTAVYEYYGNGPSMLVDGPPGLTLDPATEGEGYRDYVAGDPSGKSMNAYLRVGVGNPNPQASFEEEVGLSARFLEKNYGDAAVLTPQNSTFCSTRAATIEFSGDNKAGVRRHAIERIWVQDGVTLIVQLNAPDTEWETWRPYVDTVFADCPTD